MELVDLDHMAAGGKAKVAPDTDQGTVADMGDMAQDREGSPAPDRGGNRVLDRGG